MNTWLVSPKPSPNGTRAHSVSTRDSCEAVSASSQQSRAHDRQPGRRQHRVAPGARDVAAGEVGRQRRREHHRHHQQARARSGSRPWPAAGTPARTRRPRTARRCRGTARRWRRPPRGCAASPSGRSGRRRGGCGRTSAPVGDGGERRTTRSRRSRQPSMKSRWRRPAARRRGGRAARAACPASRRERRAQCGQRGDAERHVDVEQHAPGDQSVSTPPISGPSTVAPAKTIEM